MLYEFNVLNEKTQEMMEIYGSVKKNVIIILLSEWNQEDGPMNTKLTNFIFKWLAN